MNIKDMILAVDDLPRKPVKVKEWGTTVWIKTMSGAEKDGFELEYYGEDKPHTNIRAGMLVRCLVDEQGQRIFADNEAEILGHKSAKVLSQLFTIASKLNAISATDVEELEKNSGSDLVA